MNNIFIKIPKKGDIAVKTISSGEVRYIDLDTFSAAGISSSVYEIIGVVVCIKDGKVLVTRGNIGSYKYCNRAWWYLSGYTLDGTARTGVLSLRFTSNSWESNINKTINYNASTLNDFISQLNTAFAEDSDMSGQDWYANITSDNRVRIHCNNIDYRQCAYNTASTGFTLTSSLPEITYSSAMLRRNGANSGEGSISNMSRALSYFHSDLNSTTYNPNSNITSVKRGYPICLPGYLGTSQYQSDHCSYLRGIYGAGEEGWKKFMAAQLPVLPSDYGIMKVQDGKERTSQLASFYYTSSAQSTPSPMCAAASAAYNVSTAKINVGEFHLPTTEELSLILDGVLYGTDASRNADILNKGLNAINFPAISNGSYLWSCCRYSSSYGWCALGTGGFFDGSYMCNTYGVCPVSLYKIA